MATNYNFGEVILQALANEEERRMKQEALRGETEHRKRMENFTAQELEMQRKENERKAALDEIGVGMEQAKLDELYANNAFLRDEEKKQTQAALDEKGYAREAMLWQKKVAGAQLDEFNYERELVTADVGLPPELRSTYRELVKEGALDADFFTRTMRRSEWARDWGNPQVAEARLARLQDTQVRGMEKQVNSALDKISVPEALPDTDPGGWLKFEAFTGNPKARKEYDAKGADLQKAREGQIGTLLKAVDPMRKSGEVAAALAEKTGDPQKMKPWLDKASLLIKHFDDLEASGTKFPDYEQPFINALKTRYYAMFKKLKDTNDALVIDLYKKAEEAYVTKGAAAAGTKAGQENPDQFRPYGIAP